MNEPPRLREDHSKRKQRVTRSALDQHEGSQEHDGSCDETERGA